MYKDSANGVKDVWLLPSITGGRAESARCVASCWPGGSLAGPSFTGSWRGLRGGSELTASSQLTSVGGDGALRMACSYIKRVIDRKSVV